MKLIKRIMSVLNITFKEDRASRAGVTFRKNRRDAQLSVMVGSAIYNNVYGIITDKISDADMKGIANNMANIANIGKLISEEMKKTQVKPHGRWFVTSNTVRTQVKDKNGIYNVAYSKDTGKQIGKLKLLSSSEVKPASIPALRNKKVVKRQEAAKAASPQFNMARFHKYVELVADFRKYYKVNAKRLLSSKLNKEAKETLDLNNPEQVLYEIIKQVRMWNGKDYKVSIESEVESIIKKVNKIKEERKEAAKAVSSLLEESNNKIEFINRNEENNMRNLVTEILRSLGVRHALVLQTNDWTISFIHNGYVTDITLTKSLLTKKLYMSLFRYDDGKIVDLHKEELADITEEKLREVIKEFINRKESAVAGSSLSEESNELSMEGFEVI